MAPTLVAGKHAHPHPFLHELRFLGDVHKLTFPVHQIYSAQTAVVAGRKLDRLPVLRREPQPPEQHWQIGQGLIAHRERESAT